MYNDIRHLYEMFSLTKVKNV